MSKYKYYFKKPKSEITKDIFRFLLVSGLLTIAVTSPYFIRNLIGALKRIKKFKKYKNKKVYDVFYKLRKDGHIKISYGKSKLVIRLTESGKRMAGWMQIDDLKIKKPKKWDKKWRLLAFDIAQSKKLYRNVFRSKLQELNFLPFQKSIWINPYKCKDEIDLLVDFFGFTCEEVRLVIAESIGDDKKFKNLFKLT